MTTLKALSEQQNQWVHATLDGMSIEDCAGQLLCPMVRPGTTDQLLPLLEKVPLGSLFFLNTSHDELRNLLPSLNERLDIPLLVAGDLERGANALGKDATSFPWTMGAGAANDAALMYTRGEATAVEGRYAGLNWTFSPVIDLNLNYKNPITNIRSLSDDPDRVIRLAIPWIQGMQEHGIMATAKHFPGDGIDDRDQHLLTTLNTLPMDEWWELYGKVWKAVIEAGVRCIMPGHISLPDYQGYQDNPIDAPPATIDPKILQTLLREELGYDGLIVSDATSMNGLTTRLASERRIVESVKAGIDVYLFPDTIDDYHHLVNAVHSGDLSEECLRDATRRVLEAKAWLNLQETFFGAEPTSEQTETYEVASVQQAEKSITLVRESDNFPVSLSPEARILTVSIGQINPAFGGADIEAFDAALIERGYQVTHMVNPENEELRSAAKDHDAVFINNLTTPYATPGTVLTIVGHFNHWAWRSIFMEHPFVYYTAFGNPYLLHEMPHIPNLIATFGTTVEQQRAAVRVWLGEIEAQGSLPVTLSTVRIQSHRNN